MFLVLETRGGTLWDTYGNTVCKTIAFLNLLENIFASGQTGRHVSSTIFSRLPKT